MHRMARAPEPPAPPAEAGPLLARAMRRAADRVARLDLRVSGSRCVTETVGQMLEVIDPDDMMIALLREERVVGVALLSPDMRAALVEAQTIGVLTPTAAEPRRPTGSDVAMARPTLTRFFDELAMGATGTEIDGWTGDLAFGHRVKSVKELELTLPDVEMGAIELTCALGETERSGRLRLCLPLPTEEPEQSGEDVGPSWQSQWRAVVDHVPARLEAVLHRLRLDLPSLEAMAPGDVLPLSGASVGSLELMAQGGAVAATGRLGQMGGFRAVRIEAPPADLMIEEMGLGGSVAAGGDLMSLPDIDPPMEGGAPDLGALEPDGMDLPDLPVLEEGLPELPDSPDAGAEPEMPELAQGLPDLPDIGGDLPDLDDGGEVALGDLPDLDLPDGTLPDLPDLPSLDDL